MRYSQGSSTLYHLSPGGIAAADQHCVPSNITEPEGCLGLRKNSKTIFSSKSIALVFSHKNAMLFFKKLDS